MAVTKLFEAKNVNTGEVIRGTSTELSARIGVPVKTIHEYSAYYSRYKNEWIFTDKGVIQKGWAERWDEFTEPIRQYIRRRDAKRK